MTDEFGGRVAPVRVIAGSLLAIVCLVASAFAVARASEVFLILFLGVLFAVFLTRLSTILSPYFGGSYYAGLGVITGALVISAVGGLALFGARVESQIEKAQDHSDEASQQLRAWADKRPALKTVMQSTPFVRDLVAGNRAPLKHTHGPPDSRSDSDSSMADNDSQESTASNGLSQAERSALKQSAKRGAAAVGQVFRTTFGLVVNSLLIFFVGLFLAVSPESYRTGLSRLFPRPHRERVVEILDQTGNTLWDWLLGRFGSMLVTGFGAGCLLFLLGVPMAVTLGIVTALLTFIPNIGGVVALALAMLFAAAQGGSTVMMVVVGYVCLQLVESYIVTPLIQQKQSSLPPALLIAFQAIMGVLFGLLGAAVASPMLAAGKLVVEKAYINDFLERDTGE